MPDKFNLEETFLLNEKVDIKQWISKGKEKIKDVGDNIKKLFDKKETHSSSVSESGFLINEFFSFDANPSKVSKYLDYITNSILYNFNFDVNTAKKAIDAANKALKLTDDGEAKDLLDNINSEISKDVKELKPKTNKTSEYSIYIVKLNKKSFKNMSSKDKENLCKKCKLLSKKIDEYASQADKEMFAQEKRRDKLYNDYMKTKAKRDSYDAPLSTCDKIMNNYYNLAVQEFNYTKQDVAYTKDDLDNIYKYCKG